MAPKNEWRTSRGNDERAEPVASAIMQKVVKCVQGQRGIRGRGCAVTINKIQSITTTTATTKGTATETMIKNYQTKIVPVFTQSSLQFTCLSAPCAPSPFPLFPCAGPLCATVFILFNKTNQRVCQLRSLLASVSASASAVAAYR